jgi:hypothetical protein
MPRVVPSQVVAFIDDIFPATEELCYLHKIDFGQLAGLVDLVEEIPNELLTMDTTTYASFVCSKAKIREAISNFTADRRSGHHFSPFTIARNQSPMRLIRDAIAKCPDESPAPATFELSFISDTELRANLRNELGAINRALSNGEWKAATVLAGSNIEALLLWGLQRNTPTATSAAAALLRSGALRRQPTTDLESWTLHEYIEVAAHLSIIKPDTAIQARLAKDFRNLIHPGRAQRLAQKCDRATALSAVAGVELVIRDQTP